MPHLFSCIHVLPEWNHKGEARGARNIKQELQINLNIILKKGGAMNIRQGREQKEF